MEIKELQEKIKALKNFRTEYDNMKKQLAELDGFCEILETQIMQHFEENDMTSFRVDGVALITVSEKYTVQTPKKNEDKKAFFDWVARNKGEEVRDSMMTVNSMTLNSFYKAELESLEGDDKLMFQIDGIQPPSMVKKISVRKA